MGACFDSEWPWPRPLTSNRGTGHDHVSVSMSPAKQITHTSHSLLPCLLGFIYTASKRPHLKVVENKCVCLCDRGRSRYSTSMQGPSWEKCTLKRTNLWMFGCQLEDFFLNLSCSFRFKITAHSFLHTTPDTMTLLPDTEHTHMHWTAH